MKQEYPEDDTIIDDMAAQAYVEQFGLETLQRAQNTMDANKVSRYVKQSHCVAGFSLT